MKRGTSRASPDFPYHAPLELYYIPMARYHTLAPHPCFYGQSLVYRLIQRGGGLSLVADIIEPTFCKGSDEGAQAHALRMKPHFSLRSVSIRDRPP